MTEVTKDDAVIPANMYRNVLLLSLSWSFSIAAAFTQISTTALVLKDIVNSSVSTVPLGVLLLCGAFSAAMVPTLMDKYGNKTVLCIGALLGVIGAGIQLAGVLVSETDGPVFALLTVGTIPQGFNYACASNYRLTAVRLSSEKFAPTALSLVVGGGMLGAFLGPELAKSSRDWLSIPFAGAYVHMILLYVLLFFTLVWVDFSPLAKAKGPLVPETPAPKTKIMATFCRPEFQLVMSLQAISYASMAALMGATPLAMHDEGFDFTQSSTAITAHMLGMFVPSLFCGSLIVRFGAYPVCFAGFVLGLAGAAAFLVKQSLLAFILGITLVGVGWNLSFVAASARVTKLYNEESRRVVQSINEFIVIGSIGLTMVLTGLLYDRLGLESFVILWIVVMGVALLATAAMIVLLRVKTPKSINADTGGESDSQPSQTTASKDTISSKANSAGDNETQANGQGTATIV